jgi:hypothetical protein
MFARIKNPAMPARDYLLDFKLVVRQSTALSDPGSASVPSLESSASGE